MHIKSLELTGFKSFHDKTKVDFNKGINAIVGPNGCGKSNIIDAIRWVLGEQNPRTLRADAMKDLVSNGSDVLKPYGMAEVSMVVNGLPGLSFEDVNIKRRLYRSGESEYYINGIESRLKDVTELFLDTGAGAGSYSIIGQGKVEEFITAKPEEKRKLIEEVAGVVKYKTRRKETQSRIKTAQENLIRVSDMKSELLIQMKNLSKQAKEAEKYKRLNSELAVLEISILDLQSSEMEAEKNALLQTRSELENKITGLQEQKVSKTKVLGEEELKSSSIDESVDRLEEEVRSIESQINEKKAFLEYADKQRESIDEFTDRLEKDTGSLENEKLQNNEDTDRKKKYLEQHEITKQKIQTQLKVKTEELEKLKVESESNKTELEQSKQLFFDILNRHSSIKGTAEVVSRELDEIKLRKAKMEQEKADLKKQSDQLSAALDGLKSEHKSLKHENTELENDRSQQKNTCEVKRKSYNDLTRSISDIKEKINEASSRADVLKNIQASYEWLPEVTRDFIINKSFNGVIGIISDFITVPKKYEKALEAALGEKANWVAVKSSNEAVEAISRLRTSSKGRSTFIPVQNIGHSDTSEIPKGKYQRLTDLITVRNIDPDIIGSVLKDVFVVPTIKDAIEAKNSSDEPALYATLEGDFIDASGSITGGFASGGVFEKRREVEELDRELERLGGEHKNKSDELERVLREVNDIESRIKNLDSLLKEKEIKVVELEKDISNTASTVAGNEKNISKITGDIEELDGSIKDRQNKVLKYSSDLKDLEKDREEVNLRFNKFETVVKSYENREKLIEKDITELKVQAAALDETQRSTRREIDDLTERTSRIVDKINEQKDEIMLKEREKTELADRKGSAVKDIEELENRSGVTRQELSGIKEERQRAKETLNTDRQNIADIDQELTQMREDRSSCEIKLQSVVSELDHVRERTQRISEEKNLGKDVDGKNAYKDVSLDELNEKYQKMKQKVDGYGLVNLLAPEEYQKLEERHDLLSKNTEDIESSLDDLKKAIKKLDRESITRFKKTFEEVNDKFGEIVSKLFHGGEGKLIITDPDDLLETGIEVMVKPRGKRFQSMNLLSGGEKAISAIALIMSACLIKPVPFLLLDEIDAPLDEANTTRFSKLVREIAKNSQVVLITHNKITMLEVDTLTGITADRSAVSKVVTAELNVA